MVYTGCKDLKKDFTERHSQHLISEFYVNNGSSKKNIYAKVDISLPLPLESCAFELWTIFPWFLTSQRTDLKVISQIRDEGHFAYLLRGYPSFWGAIFGFTNSKLNFVRYWRLWWLYMSTNRYWKKQSESIYVSSAIHFNNFCRLIQEFSLIEIFSLPNSWSEEMLTLEIINTTMDFLTF